MAMCAHYVELLVDMEEGNEQAALQMTQDFDSHHSAIAATPEFRGLREEVATLRGILLGNVDSWKEAKHVLERTTPPESYKSLHSFYLGRCYYQDKEYSRARIKLAEALAGGLDGPMEGQAHYLLGLVEYYLSEMNAAKEQF